MTQSKRDFAAGVANMEAAMEARRAEAVAERVARSVAYHAAAQEAAKERRRELVEFTKAALTGLLANGEHPKNAVREAAEIGRRQVDELDK